MADLATRMFSEVADEFNVKPDFNVVGGVLVDVVANDNEYVLTADLPGLSEEEVRVHVENRVLAISAEQQDETKDVQERMLRVERRKRQYQRSFRLPKDVDEDGIVASMDKGVLKLIMPRSGKKPAGRTIPLVKGEVKNEEGESNKPDIDAPLQR
jgi:HSP20 family protein